MKFKKRFSVIARKLSVLVLSTLLILSQSSIYAIGSIEASNQSQVHFYLEQIELEKGETGDTGLFVQNLPTRGLAGYQLRIDYNPLALEVTGVEPTETQDSSSQLVSSINSDHLEIVGARSESLKEISQLATIKVKALGQEGTKSFLEITVIKVTDSELLDLSSSAQAGVVNIKFKDEMHLTKVKNVYAKAPQLEETAASPWNGNPNNLPSATLEARAGDLLQLEAIPLEAGIIQLPQFAMALLIGPDGRSWELANLDSPGINNKLSFRLPKTLGKGDYILSAKLPSGTKAAEGIVLQVLPEWTGQNEILPIRDASHTEVNLRQLTTNLLLPNKIATVAGVALPDNEQITVSWSSSDNQWLEINSPNQGAEGNQEDYVTGIVHRPSYLERSKTLTLTATFNWAGSTQKKTLQATVLARSIDNNDTASLIADNLTSFIPSIEKLKSLTTSSQVELPLEGNLQVPGDGQSSTHINADITWQVYKDGKIDPNCSVENDNGKGIVVVNAQPLYGSPNVEVTFEATVHKGIVERSHTSQGQKLSFLGIILAETKPAETIISEAQALAAQVSNAEPETQVINAQTASTYAAELAASFWAANSGTVSALGEALTEQLEGLISPLLESLQTIRASNEDPTLVADATQAAANIVESTAAIAQALVSNPNLNQTEEQIQSAISLTQRLAEILTVTLTTLSEIQDPQIQTDISSAKNNLDKAYKGLSSLLSEQMAVDGTEFLTLNQQGNSSIDADALGEALASSVNQITASISGLQHTLEQVDAITTQTAPAVILNAPSQTLATPLPTQTLGTIVENNLSLSIVPPSANGDTQSGLTLPAGVLQQALQGAGGDTLDISIVPVPLDELSLQQLAGDSEVLVVPFSIDIKSNGQSLDMENFSTPAWITLPIQPPMTVAEAQSLKESGNLVVQYYSSTLGVWQTLTADPEDILINASTKAIQFPTTHFTQFLVNTKSSDTDISELRLKLGNANPIELDTSLVSTSLTLPFKENPSQLTLTVVPHDPAATISGTIPFISDSRGHWTAQTSVHAENTNRLEISTHAVDGTTETRAILLSGMYINSSNDSENPDLGIVGKTYTKTTPLVVFSPNGGVAPYTWQRTTFNGLELTPTGQIIGTPTTPGLYTINLSVSDCSNPSIIVQKNMYIKILEVLDITTSTLSGATKGSVYEVSLSAQGGLGHYTWSLAEGSSLPEGITLTPNGVLRGTPTQVGSWPITLIVQDDGAGGQISSRTLILNVTQPAPAGGGGGIVPGGNGGSGPVNGVWPINPTSEQRQNTSASQSVNPGQDTTITAHDGTQISLEANTVRQPSTLSIELGSVGNVPRDSSIKMFDPLLTQRKFAPEGITFSSPALITVPYAGIGFEGFDYRNLALFYWNDSDWVKVGGVVDPVQQTVTAPVYHFSTYAVMADTAIQPDRLAGLDRYQTAVAVSKQGWKIGSDQVVLVNAYSFADALAATPLAFKLSASILLTDSNTLPSETLSELQRLNAKKVIFIGAEGVISSEVKTEVENLGLKVERLGGADRYETAALVADALGTKGKAVVVSGEDYPDALSMASWAAYHGVPILYTQKDKIPDSSLQALTQNKVVKTVVAGGGGALSEDVYNSLPGASRYYGNDRYETATAVAQGLKLNSTLVYVATGLNFVDALVAGNLAAQTNAPLIMADSELPAATKIYLESIRGKVLNLTVIGGNGVITDEQKAALQALVH